MDTTTDHFTPLALRVRGNNSYTCSLTNTYILITPILSHSQIHIQCILTYPNPFGQEKKKFCSDK